MNPEDCSAPIERRCMRDHIRDTLLQRILDGSLAAGERLIELNLAREFHVSQTPVREALRELEAMGAVKSERYCGTHVRPADMTELVESYELRAILEERAAQLAVPCPRDMLDELGAALENMKCAATEHDLARYTLNAVLFHRRIIEQSGNHLFLHTWNTLHAQARVHFVALRLGDLLPDFAQEHEPILEALRAGDGHQAGRLLRQMLERLLPLITRSDPPPHAAN